MIHVLPRPGCPSPVHESRLETLATLAKLTGHCTEVDVLPEGGRPDVFLIRPGDASMFIGDAKATETPGTAATALRLSQYAHFLALYIRSGGSGVLALAVPERDRYGWLQLLRDLSVDPSGGHRVRGHVDVIEAGTAVVWQEFAGARE